MQPSNQTTVTGAALGAAIGAILVWLIEVLSHVDIPSAVEGSILVVVTALVSLVYPPQQG